MLFVDYTFRLLPDGSLLFDSEISAQALSINPGDRFQATITAEGEIMFKKLNPSDKP
jgi:hypothetical protein